MEKVIHFVNGAANNVNLPVGEYTFLSCGFPGYTDAAVSNFTVTRDTKSITIPLIAAGTLSVTVCDDKKTPFRARHSA